MRFDGDARSDEISLQLAHCLNCDEWAVLVYEESRRGSLDNDSWTHRGYRLAPTQAHEIKRWFAMCPDKNDECCRCCAHIQLSQQDAAGRWDGLKGFPLGDSFFVN